MVLCKPYGSESSWFPSHDIRSKSRPDATDQAYSEPCQTSKLKRFVKIVNGS